MAPALVVQNYHNMQHMHKRFLYRKIIKHSVKYISTQPFKNFVNEKLFKYLFDQCNSASRYLKEVCHKIFTSIFHTLHPACMISKRQNKYENAGKGNFRSSIVLYKWKKFFIKIILTNLPKIILKSSTFYFFIYHKIHSSLKTMTTFGYFF